MSLWTRVWNALRGDAVNRELNEEFEAHMEDAVAEGRDPEEVRRAFGSMLRQREASRRVRVAGWLDGLRADVIFGWRQLRRNRVTSAAAVLSLALAMGACVSAFRLIDALLWRPLPVAEPERLYAISLTGISMMGEQETWDSFSYPMFQKMREAVKGDAELIALSYSDRTDLAYGSNQETEQANQQYVSGWMFEEFGLRPAVGRLLTTADDREPGKHPVAVLSYDYWNRRFGRDPRVVGRTLRIGHHLFEIVGVSGKGFTGTEPGTVTDIFLPMMMNAETMSSNSENEQWFRILVRITSGHTAEPVRGKLQALYIAMETERARGWTYLPKNLIDEVPKAKLSLVRAGSGISQMQTNYRNALTTIGALVLLVLLIACVNVANLMTALAGARAREMALRVSIGAGRWRLVQMVLAEGALMALMAAALGGVFAWWSAPLVVRMINPPDNPARLVLPADWRVLGFGVALLMGVTLLFGLMPALRASAVKPVSVLKGGDVPNRRQWMFGMVAAQVAFCFLVVFVGGLFVATFKHLSDVRTGFQVDRMLALHTVASQELPLVAWDQMANRVRSTPGVESVAMMGWALMGGISSNNVISVHDAPPSNVLAFTVATSPGWLETMKIPLLSGRDFLMKDTDPQVAIVNQRFARQFFGSEKVVGQRFKTAGSKTSYEIVGICGDAGYRNVREPIMPMFYVPLRRVAKAGTLLPSGQGTVMVRASSGDPKALGALESALRREIHEARAEFRVSSARTQRELIDAQTVRERLLAMLGVFFAGVALLLAGIGLYGVLNYSVLQRRREIGIRVAVGARGVAIARLVTGSVFSMVAVGVAAGVGLGLASARYMESLFFQVKASDASMLLVPSAVILVVALVATVPAVLRALRVDPVEILRAE
jgi:putative ABC transport system permease protein